jgi:hypothetical protein
MEMLTQIFFISWPTLERRKKIIHTLQTENGVAVSQREKQDVIFDHFSHHIGTYVPRSCTLNFQALGWQPHPLHHLEVFVSEEELHEVIRCARRRKLLGQMDLLDCFSHNVGP